MTRTYQESRAPNGPAIDMDFAIFTERLICHATQKIPSSRIFQYASMESEVPRERQQGSKWTKLKTRMKSTRHATLHLEYLLDLAGV